jgi:hypothetical protein
LNNIKLDHADVFETVQLLAASVNKLFSAAKDADERCQQLTNGSGYCFLLGSLEKLVKCCGILESKTASIACSKLCENRSVMCFNSIKAGSGSLF